MDVRVSRKERRLQPSGPVDVLVSDVFDYYPIFSPTDENLIVDVEMLDDARGELLDRCLFATVVQRGTDPLDRTTGVQWAQSIMGEVPIPAIMAQVQVAVQAEGAGVKVSFESVQAVGGKEYLQFRLDLTNAI